MRAIAGLSASIDDDVRFVEFILWGQLAWRKTFPSKFDGISSIMRNRPYIDVAESQYVTWAGDIDNYFRKISKKRIFCTILASFSQSCPPRETHRLRFSMRELTTLALRDKHDPDTTIMAAEGRTEPIKVYEQSQLLSSLLGKDARTICENRWWWSWWACLWGFARCALPLAVRW